MISQLCAPGLLILFLGASLSAQDPKPRVVAGLESSYLVLQGAVLGEVTGHDAMMLSYHVPMFIDRLRQSGRPVPEAVTVLLTSAREAYEKKDSYRAFRLFVRAAGLAQGAGKVEASEVAASYKLFPERAIYSGGERIAFTLRPLFSLGHPLTGAYTIRTWLENTSGVIAGTDQHRALTDLKAESFVFSIEQLADGVVAICYRLDREMIAKLAGLRILFSAAEKDPSSLAGARRINPIASELVPGFKYVEYPGTTHDGIWGKALPAIFDFFNAAATGSRNRLPHLLH